MIRILKWITLSTWIVMASACTHFNAADVTVAKEPSEDQDFDAALEKASRNRTVSKDFETRFMIHATYLSPEFRAAFAKRLEEVYKRNDVELGEAGQKAGFFVSIQSFDETRTDLTNNQHWTIQLKTREGVIRPILIKPLLDKERWRAFFPSVDTWSKDFIVVFDIPSIDANAAKLVEKTPVTVTFANADAQVELTW
jgi:hypothetical protein